MSLLTIMLSAKTSFSQDPAGDFYRLLDLRLPGMDRLGVLVEKADWESAAIEYKLYRQKQSTAKWKIEPVPAAEKTEPDNDKLADSIVAHYIKDQTNPIPIVPAAVYMGKDFDWKYNPIPKDSPSFDDGWSWAVMSRAKFFTTLANAYRKTRNPVYAEKWVWMLNDFIKDNPLPAYTGKKVDQLIWRTLDAAIRVTSLMNAYFSFRDAPAFKPSDQLAFSKLIYDHAMRLYTVLENDPKRTGNWVTTECYGLYVVGAIFPEFKEATAWRNAAITRFSKEIDRVVPEDGLQAELSPSYHYGVVAAYHGIYEIGRMNNLELPSSFLQRLVDMYRAPVLIMDQGGGFVRTNDSNPRDIRALSKKGLELGYDPLLAWAASNGKKGKAPPTTTVLPNAGFYMMRSGWAKDDLFLFFRGGPAGIGHIEQDMLQVVLRAKDKTLLFDPGKYNYDQSRWRRFSINTPSHNTIIIDGKWQNRAKIIPEKYTPVNNPFVTSVSFDYVSATYAEGYETNKYDSTVQYKPEKWMGDRDTTVQHTRKILFLKPWYALVVDEIRGSGSHQVDAHFHLDAPNAVYDSSKSLIYTQREDNIQLALFSFLNEGLQTSVIKGQQDPLLGWQPVDHRPIPTVRYRKELPMPAGFATFLYPFEASVPVLKSKELQTGSSLFSRHISTDKEEIEVCLNTGSEVKQIEFVSDIVGSVNGSANMLMVRKSKTTHNYLVGAYALRSYKDKNIELSSPEDVSLLFSLQKKKVLIQNGSDKKITIEISRPFTQKVVLPGGGSATITAGKIVLSDKPLQF